MLDIVQSTKDLPESLAETGDWSFPCCCLDVCHACPLQKCRFFQDALDLRGADFPLQMQCLAFCQCPIKPCGSSIVRCVESGNRAECQTLHLEGNLRL